MKKKLPPSLKSELSKLAKLGNLQSGLPPFLHPVPGMVIRAGEALSKYTDGRNIIEERILGLDETFMLAAPSPIPTPNPNPSLYQQQITTVDKEVASMRTGIEMMCGRCSQDKQAAMMMTTTNITASGHAWGGVPRRVNHGQFHDLVYQRQPLFRQLSFRLDVDAPHGWCLGAPKLLSPSVFSSTSS